MTIATLSEGPAILVGYAWRLQIEAEAPVFADGASYAGHLRLKPSDVTLLAELSSADGGIQHITATVLELSLTPAQTAGLSPGRVVLDLVRTDLEPDLHLGIRLVRRTAMQTAVRMITTALMLALLAGIAIKLKIFGGSP